MINRRRPIQSIVAGRKMFSNGGVVPPPLGAPPMGAPPMGAPPMGAPPMGILNSSPELAQAASFSQPPPTLVDSMVNEATAGYGQGLQDSTAMNAAPMPMAHGGLASEDMINHTVMGVLILTVVVQQFQARMNLFKLPESKGLLYIVLGTRLTRMVLK